MTAANSKREVTVLGAGIVGVCCALALRERGHRVTLIDRQPPGEATSYGNAGVISPWSCAPNCMPGTLQQIPGWLMNREGPVSFRWRDMPRTLPWVRQFLANANRDKVEPIADAMAAINRLNIPRYREFLAGTDHANLIQDSLHVNAFRGDARPSLTDFTWQLRIDRGAPVELLDAAELKAIEPAISPEYHSAVIFRDQARATAPGRLCKVLAEEAFRKGVRFVENKVQTLARRSDGALELVFSDRRETVDQLVLAAGIWSADLLRDLGFGIPLISERGYHLEFDSPGVSVNNSILDVAGKFIVSSMEGGVRAAGTSEFAHHEAPANMQRAELLRQQTKRLLPDLNSADANRWMGVRPSLPDNLPAIGPIPKHPGLFAAFGHSHWGLGMAPGTGDLIAELVSGVKPSVDPAPYSPARFSKSMAVRPNMP